MSSRWNPWRALRERPHITLRTGLLRNARGVWIPNADGTSVIVLDERLSRRSRRCVLAHELVHEERGIVYSRGTPAGLIQAEERAVTSETVRRLVPLPELLKLLQASAPEVVAIWEVADEFDVDWATARAAMAMVG